MVLPRIAVYAGTFDPIHNGHIGIITRGITLFDKVVVGVAEDTGKKALFCLEERVAMAKKYFDQSEYKDVVIVEPFSGLLVEYAKSHDAVGILRGLRAISDFDYEFQMALMNRKLEPSIQTMFLMSDFKWMYVSSTNLKNVASLNGDITDLVPAHVYSAMQDVYAAQKNSATKK